LVFLPLSTVSGKTIFMKITRKQILFILLNAVVLIVIGNLVVLTVFPVSEFTVYNFLSNSIYSLLIGGSMAIGITRITNWLDKQHPWLKNPLKRLVIQFSMTLGYCLLVIAVVIIVMILLFEGSDYSGFIAESGWFMIKTAVVLLSLSMLITNAIIFFVNWRKSVIMQEQMKREQLALQYETLKSQVNPHFLFNSLNAVTSLISTDPDKAIQFVKKLSEVFRYVLEQKDNELTTLDAELDFLESYIFLQKIRFGENLMVNINVQERNRYIIPLSLQMLIENAIKHNVVSKEFPLTIHINSKNGKYLAVNNNLRKKPAIGSSNLGLENIRSRYGFFTTNPVVVTETENEFRVEIPLLEK
jgi:two-component system, LytTR family, sensor kinase